MYENSCGFFSEKMVRYFFECGTVCFVFCGFVALRLGVCCMEVNVGDGMFEVSMVGFDQERVGRNVFTVVVVSSFVCYSMFTISGDLLFEFATLV